MSSSQENMLITNTAILTKILKMMIEKEIELERVNELAFSLLEIGLIKQDIHIQKAVQLTINSVTDKAWIGIGTTIYSLLLLSFFNRDYASITQKGIEWIYACQNNDGGLGRFQGDRSRIPVTWRVIKALTRVEANINEKKIKMIQWLEKEWSKDMESGGLSYKGAGVLLANAYAPGHMSNDLINSSINWLINDQLDQGGWSAYNEAPVGPVPSYTALALQALLFYSQEKNVRDAIDKGLIWMNNSRVEGYWQEHPLERPVIDFSLALNHSRKV
jgi:prenyltransferase beta subunit